MNRLNLLRAIDNIKYPDDSPLNHGTQIKILLSITSRAKKDCIECHEESQMR
jgi:hypothetical protein